MNTATLLATAAQTAWLSAHYTLHTLPVKSSDAMTVAGTPLGEAWPLALG
jgi:hypothetical protein